MTKKIDLTANLLWRNGRSYDPKFYYGSETAEEYMLRNQGSLPRYGPLARKVLAHYLGDKYDAQIELFTNECIIREHIQCLIQFKIIHRLKKYDWEYIDNIFKWMISGMYEIKLHYDQSRIDQGFAPVNQRHEDRFIKLDG